MWYIKTNMMWYYSSMYKTYKEALLESKRIHKIGYEAKIIRK